MNDAPKNPEELTFDAYGYEVVQNAEHPRLAVIRKSGIKEDFTVRDTQKSIEEMLKGRVQFDNAKKMADAFLQNLRDNHPEIASFIEALDGPKFAAVSLYCEHKKKADVAESTIADIDRAIALYRAEIEHVSKVTGLDFSVGTEALPVDALKPTPAEEAIPSPYAGAEGDTPAEPAQ